MTESSERCPICGNYLVKTPHTIWCSKCGLLVEGRVVSTYTSTGTCEVEEVEVNIPMRQHQPSYIAYADGHEGWPSLFNEINTDKKASPVVFERTSKEKNGMKWHNVVADILALVAALLVLGACGALAWANTIYVLGEIDGGSIDSIWKVVAGFVIVVYLAWWAAWTTKQDRRW